MRVILKRNYQMIGRMWNPGEVVDVPWHIAEALVLDGSAVMESEPQPAENHKGTKAKRNRNR